MLTFYRTTMIDRALDSIDIEGIAPGKNRSFGRALAGFFDRIVEDWPGQTAERRARLDPAGHEHTLMAICTQCV